MADPRQRFHLPMVNSSEIQNLEEDALLAHDALLLIAKATHDVMRNVGWNQSSINTSLFNNLLKEYILKARVQGVTGDININSHFVREVKELQILNLRNNKSVQIGIWTSSGGILLSQPMSINFQTDMCKQPPLEGHTLRVTVLENHPYVIKYNKSGTTAYKGFCIDLLDELSRDLKFNYVIEDTPDQKYGAVINGKWNGMIRELIDKKADMAGAPLAITEIREKVVDFTVPFEHFTENLLFARPKEEYRPFGFIDPLSDHIWFCLAGTVCCVGILTYLLNYFSPYGWKDENGQGTAKQLSFLNSLWFAFACFLQQGTSDRPKSLSGRIFSGVYWFCILVVVSTYTANLTAFFTAKSASTTIKNIQDLAMDSEKAVGVTYASSTYTFFEHTEYEEFQKLWNRMKRFPNNTQQAIEWAKQGNYVHIEASPIVEHAAAQHCDLMTVPGIIHTQGLAFALQQGSIYTKNITLSLLRMNEQRFITEKKKYWWKQKMSCPKHFTDSLESKKVQLTQMLGVYIVFCGGSLLAFIVLIIEIIWNRQTGHKADIGTTAELCGAPSEQRGEVISLYNIS